ncbi:enterotoxin [Xenorhabdus sp. PB30.3]|uniref:enterotoxin n=1 Tax=Xenorhabdus sp. PB30.3 TaxID=2788941 RepID=UPI001E4CD9DF|nr:enterotoxin [Xenorhabdus sp. PB30.3]MCC8378933.1 enterotoxin [Xenorhabdus sp. PB30.3]
MKNITKVSLLSLLISNSAFAANYVLTNDNIKISFEEPKSVVTIQDKPFHRQITSQELFFLTLPNQDVIHTSDFKIKHIEQLDNAIKIDYSHKDFNVTVVLSMLKKKYASINYTIAAVGKPREITNITFFPTKQQSPTPYIDGEINSSPIIANPFVILPKKPFVNTNVHEASSSLNVELKMAIQPKIPLSYTIFLGTFPETNQLRRSVNQLINALRPRPYKPYLHYNSWMDIGFGSAYTEQDVLKRIDEWNKEFITGRGVKLDAFLLDDGWDDLTGRWLFSPAFSHFDTVRNKAASLHSSIGLWLSPWGGYGGSGQIRVSHAKEYGFETADGRLALSGPNYFKSFNAQVLNLIKNEHITSFKLDGMGNANSHIEGSPFASDFDASIALINNMRAANKDLFINLTTGTTASPSWLFYADSIWRQGADINLDGKGSPAQKWVTYRDAETYRSIVKKSPLLPLNSLMYHGIVSAKSSYDGLEKVQTDGDFADQVWSYFATGSQLQELYITPSMLNKAKWDTLAKAAKWSQSNSDVLIDSHWIGGDPHALKVYGWASWNKRKAILGLRNPSDKAQTYYLDMAKDFEIPRGETSHFRLIPVYGNNATVPENYTKAVTVTLKPLEMLVFEAVPMQ